MLKIGLQWIKKIYIIIGVMAQKGRNHAECFRRKKQGHTYEKRGSETGISGGVDLHRSEYHSFRG
jgi:hypothetical protein